MRELLREKICIVRHQLTPEGCSNLDTSQIQKILICIRFINAVVTECFGKDGAETVLKKNKEKARVTESGEDE